MDSKLLKDIAEQVAQFSEDGHTDDEIDEGLFETYPELQTKDNYDENGEYIVGSTYREFIMEMAREKAPRGSKRYFLNLAHNFLDTATFGFGKKLAALTASVIHDKDYDDVYSTLTEEENRFTDLRPEDAMASRVAGGFTPGPAMVAKGGYNLLAKTPFLGKLLAPKAGATVGNIAKETAKSVPVGMGESALYTAGTSGSVDEFGERVLPEMVATGIGSAGLTPAMIGVGKGLTGAGRFAKRKLSGDAPLATGVARADDDRALEVMVNAKKAGYSDAEIKLEIERIREIDPELAEKLTMMDVAGDSFIPPTMAAAKQPGKAFAESAKNIKPFFKEQVERLQRFSAKTLLKKDSVAEFRADVKERRLKAGKLYDDLWFKIKGWRSRRITDPEGSPSPLRERLTIGNDKKTTVKFDEGKEQVSLPEILNPNKKSVQAVMKAAQDLADEAGVILQPPGASGFDAEHLHFIKMGFDQVLSKYGDEGLTGVMRMEVTKNQKRLISLMDEHIPGYRHARYQYAVPTAENRAFTEGYQSLKNSIDLEKIPEMMEVKFKDFTGHEREAYKAGAANFMEQFIEQGMDSLSMTNKGRKLSQITLLKKIRGIWGDKVADQYKGFMEKHAEMLLQRAEVSPLTGSLTDARRQADKVLQFDEPGVTIPLTSREALSAGLRAQPNTQAAEELSRGAAEALTPRLTLPGPEQIMKNQADMAAWQKLQALKEKAQAARRGSVPGLLNPLAQGAANQYGNQ
jgi:hypothetical protein